MFVLKLEFSITFSKIPPLKEIKSIKRNKIFLVGFSWNLVGALLSATFKCSTTQIKKHLHNTAVF